MSRAKPRGLTKLLVSAILLAFAILIGLGLSYYRTSSSSRQMIAAVLSGPKHPGKVERTRAVGSACSKYSGRTGLVGVLSVPQIGLLGPIEDYSSGGYSNSIQLVPGSAAFGQPGNTVLSSPGADWFAKLNLLSAGDRFTLSQGCKGFVYQVITSGIVPSGAIPFPSATAVLILQSPFPLDSLSSTPSIFRIYAYLVSAISTPQVGVADWDRALHWLSLPVAADSRYGGILYLDATGASSLAISSSPLARTYVPDLVLAVSAIPKAPMPQPPFRATLDLQANGQVLGASIVASSTSSTASPQLRLKYVDGRFSPV